MTVPARLLAAVGMVIALTSPISSPAHAATAARAGTAGPCPTLTDGVTVVVDPGPLGGSIQVRCAPGSPSSGLAALQGAGFSYAFVQNVPGMVCTIDSRPEHCNGAPSDAYWAYHHAPRGGSWDYADIGAATYRPPVGSVEGWAFGGGDEPGIAAPAKPQVAPVTPPPSPPPVPQPPPPPPAGTPPQSPGAVLTTSAVSPPVRGEDASDDTATTTTGETATTTTRPPSVDGAENRSDDAPTTTVDAAAPAASIDDEDEPGWGDAAALVVALLVGLGLLGAALFINVQRARDALGDGESAS